MGRKKNYEKFLEKSVDAALCAVDLYNRALSIYKEEAFAILMTNAWELLLKSKWIYDNGNKVKSLYIKSGKRRYKKNRSGNYMTHGLDYLLKKFLETKKIPKNVYENVISLVEIRDNATHFKLSPITRKQAYKIFAASVKNFYLLIVKWFGEKYKSKFIDPIINPISVSYDEEMTFYSSSEERLYRFLERTIALQENNKEGFFIAVDIKIKFIKSKSTEDALPVKYDPKDPHAKPLRLTEDQWLEKYPWTYKDLVSKLRERYEDFKENKDFWELKKRIEPDRSGCDPYSCFNKYCRVRFLDPKSPEKSQKKRYYSSAVFKYFDKYYTKRKK